MSGDTIGRFIPGHSPVNNNYMLVIADYKHWVDHQTAIEQWMRDTLPRGTDHQTGMILTFDNEEQRNWFLLRWA